MEFNFDVTSYLKKPITVISYSNDIKVYEGNWRKELHLERIQEILDEFGISSAKAQQLKGPITGYHKLKANSDHRVYLIRDESDGEVNIDPDTGYFVHSKNVIKENVPRVTEQVKSPDTVFHEQLEGLKSTSFHKNQVYNISRILHDTKSGKGKDPKNPIPVAQRTIHGFLKVGVKNLFISDDFGRQHEIKPLCVLDFYVCEKSQRKGYGKKLFDFMLSMEGVLPAKLGYDRPSPKLLSFVRKHYGLAKFTSQANNFVIFREYGLNFLSIPGQRGTNQYHAQKGIPRRKYESIGDLTEEPRNVSKSMSQSTLLKGGGMATALIQESVIVPPEKALNNIATKMVVAEEMIPQKPVEIDEKVMEDIQSLANQASTKRRNSEKQIQSNRTNNSSGVAASLNLTNFYHNFLDSKNTKGGRSTFRTGAK